MLRNKIAAVGMATMLAAALLAGCGAPQETVNPADSTGEQTAPEQSSQQSGEAEYKDGIYFAQEKDFAESGWKYMATLEVQDGKIVKADWNGAAKTAGKNKKESSESGEYGMKERGNAQSEWHEQAALAEAYLIEKQDPTDITYTDDEGHTDAISGASIHVKEFFTLAKEALDNGPVEPGKYKDGAYHAEQKEFDSSSGWKSTVDITVVNGYIVSAYWSGISKDGGDDKYKQSVDGKYGMKERGNAQAEWHEQADKVVAYFLEKQDPTDITYTDDEGRTDAISGASVHVSDFFTLAEEALSGAER